MNDTNTLVIGIGNEFRSDDAAGLIAARKIREINYEGLDVEESAGDGAGLMDMWAGRRNVILIDAVLSGAAPGTVHRLELSNRLLPSEFFKFSTHLFSIPQAIYLSASLGTLPDKLIILGIEGKSFTAGEVVSYEAEEAINNIVKIVQKEIKIFQRNPREKLING
jgi:hydrogenase maturation protease